MATGMLGQVVTPHEPLLAQGTSKLLLACVGPIMAGQLIRSREFFKAVWPCAWKRTFTCVHSVMGFKVGRFAIDFATAGKGTPVPLFTSGAGGAWRGAGRVRAGWAWRLLCGARFGAVVRPAASAVVAVAGLCGHVTVRAELLVTVVRGGQGPVLV